MEKTARGDQSMLPGAAEGAQVSIWKRIFGWSNFWILAVLLLLVTVFTVLQPQAFPTFMNARNIALDTCVVILLAIGATYVIITSGIDLSIGSNLVLSAVVSAKVMAWLSGTPAQIRAGEFPNQWVAIPIGIAVGILTGMAWGWLNGRLITGLKLPPFIVTLGTMTMALGAANLLSGGVSIANVPPVLQTAVGMKNLFGFLPVPILITALIAAFAMFILNKTRFGRHTYAVGSNTEAARLSGINVNRHLIKVYAVQGLLAGMAGVMDLARFNSVSPASHSQTNLNAIAAVIIGGTSIFGGAGTIGGTIIGAFIPTILQNGLIINDIEPFWQQIAVGAIIVGAVYFDQLRRRNRK